MNERLKEFADSIGLTNIKMAKSLEVTRQQYEGWIKRDVKIPIHSLVKLAEVYENLNLRWFLTGKGEMTKGTVFQAAVENFGEYLRGGEQPEKDVIRFEKEFIDMQRKYVGLLEHLIKQGVRVNLDDVRNGKEILSEEIRHETDK